MGSAGTVSASMPRTIAARVSSMGSSRPVPMPLRAHGCSAPSSQKAMWRNWGRLGRSRGPAPPSGATPVLVPASSGAMARSRVDVVVGLVGGGGDQDLHVGMAQHRGQFGGLVERVDRCDHRTDARRRGPGGDPPGAIGEQDADLGALADTERHQPGGEGERLAIEVHVAQALPGCDDGVGVGMMGHGMAEETGHGGDVIGPDLGLRAVPFGARCRSGREVRGPFGKCDAHVRDGSVPPWTPGWATALPS